MKNFQQNSLTLKSSMKMSGASLMSHWVKNPPAMQETQETQVWSLDWADLLEEDMENHSSILAWKFPYGLFFDPQKRQRKLLQGPKHISHPESSSRSLESFFNLCVFCLLPKCPYSRWLLLPGAICETLKMGRKGTGVESFRWKTHGSANNSWGEGLLG